MAAQPGGWSLIPGPGPRARLARALFAAALLSAVAVDATAQTTRIPNPFGDFGNKTDVVQITCQGTTVQFARGLRWSPPDYGVMLHAFPAARPQAPGPRTELPAGCYTEMSCVTYNRTPSMLLVLAGACGGNAVGEDYLVFNLETLRHRVLDYRQAWSAGLLGR